MTKTTALVSLFVIIVLFTTASARPAKHQALSRQKRQSDQRLAELETLLALQKYGRHHRLRMDRKKGIGADGEHPPGYGIIDFRMLGRKKKSTRFSPVKLENSMKEISIVAAAVDRSKRLEEKQPQPFWTSENTSEDAFSENTPRNQPGEQLPAADQPGLTDIDKQGAVPIFYLQNKK